MRRDGIPALTQQRWKDQQSGVRTKTGHHALSGLTLAVIVEVVQKYQGKVTQMWFARVIFSSWEILFLYLPCIARLHQATLLFKSQNLCQTLVVWAGVRLSPCLYLAD